MYWNYMNSKCIDFECYLWVNFRYELAKLTSLQVSEDKLPPTPNVESKLDVMPQLVKPTRSLAHLPSPLTTSLSKCWMLPTRF